MRVLSINLNGIRAATRKGLLPWLKRVKFDVACFQEIRADLSQIPEEFSHYQNCYWCPASSKRGYSGVGIITKFTPEKVTTEFPNETVNAEGRFMEISYQEVDYISFYMPNGSSNEQRLEIKYHVMDAVFSYLKNKVKSKRKFVFSTDLNIAHQEIDLKNWRANQKRSGFLPEEREWLTKLLVKTKTIDSFRYLYPKKIRYTWWSQRGNARANNVGWRIDYQFVSPLLAGDLKESKVYDGQHFSDHAPIALSF